MAVNKVDTLQVLAERCFTRAGDTIFVPPPYCFFYIIISMNIQENRKDDNFETYDFLWILSALYHLRVLVRDFWP